MPKPNPVTTCLISFLFCMVTSAVSAQTITGYTWWKPADSSFPVIDGQAWPTEMQDTLQRLPPRAKGLVRKPVWDLSRQTAGLSIRFVSNAPEIIVRYKVTGAVALPHMPATGVSGVDLYGIDSDGTWHQAAGKYSFRDSVQYTFAQLKPNDTYHQLGREYRLYLPLYNGVRNLEIGVPAGSRFTVLPQRAEKPIVVYGTSIAQGACASRPGMAWPNILARKLDRTVINLGFSGNGRLENEVVNLVNEIDAKVFVLDCLPNLIETVVSRAELQKRIVESVRAIRARHPNTPILLTDHDGYTEGYLMPHRQPLFEQANQDLAEAYRQLTAENVPGLYRLTIADIGMDLDCMLDGTHPNDLGMMRYADAYEKKLREILQQPVGTIRTQIPTRQNREPGSYNWEERHNAMLTLNQTEPTRVVFIGNSITHNWGGKPLNNRIVGADSWQTYLEPLQVRNFGFGWDRIENVLWRVYHDELDGISPEQIVLNIGTNNLHLNTDDEIVQGLRFLVQAIRLRQPNARITLLGIYPRREQEGRVAGLNKGIQAMARSENVSYQDIGKRLLLKNGTLNEQLFSDGLHPNAAGYVLLGKELERVLRGR
ncbi:Platelet-activating factor acetylhydrolase IB subunit beta [Fibrisoma limi BUZ 3]|uniref:Platelet-activating factor acetylhydrolase IB subunit beta n=1 Tax=Fibrisoma limi BUZ 3 TaxID=1185876 RepID=I2GIL1_9BACT|nr:SGNH/GDSL hydrolase family protein [Fibrisoma limi]CCH53736.1 Platelet-activating factor acetylhydrolase IB subunit beta [Fibrisoma limi BUZ 3]